MAQYRTQQSETLDQICKRHYGSEQLIEVVYKANPSLAAQSSILPQGILIELPEVASAQRVIQQPVKLWQ